MFDSCGCKGVCESRDNLIADLMRLFFLNRDDVIVIEDGCVVKASEKQGGDNFFWQRLESNGKTRYKWKAPTSASPDDCMEKPLIKEPFTWNVDGDVTGLLHSWSQLPTDYICTLAFPNAPTETHERNEFKKPEKCALAIKHQDLSVSNNPVQKCVCRILTQKEFTRGWCPGNICHSMAQSNYSKDFHAGDDFVIRGYNLTDAAKCAWVLDILTEEMHPDDILPLLRIRIAPGEPTQALARCLTYDALPLPPKHGYTSVRESPFAADVLKGASMQRLYTDVVQSYQKATLSTWSPKMREISSEEKDESGQTVRICDLCPGTTQMNEGHFGGSKHRKRLKLYHNIERHEWDREQGCWIDVPAGITDTP